MYKCTCMSFAATPSASNDTKSTSPPASAKDGSLLI